jgi:uncharacterized integral membrane protein
MKKIFFWISVLMSLVILSLFFIFFKINSGEITINYLIGQSKLDLSICLLIAFIAGAICATTLMILGEIKMSWKISQQKSEIKHLKSRIESLHKTQG